MDEKRLKAAFLHSMQVCDRMRSEAALIELIDRLQESTARANAALNTTLAAIAESNTRIDEMEKAARRKRRPA